MAIQAPMFNTYLQDFPVEKGERDPTRCAKPDHATNEHVQFNPQPAPHKSCTVDVGEVEPRLFFLGAFTA